MRNAFMLGLLLAFATTLSGAAQDEKAIRATTNDGRQVVLRTDGTWSFVQQPSNGSANTARFVKSANATKKINAPYGQFALWIDPTRWTEMKAEPGKVVLQHANGQGYAMILSEALPIPTSTLREVALQNARDLDPNARLVAEEKRVVNGREILCLQMDATLKQVPFRYYGYYYGGTSGAIQVVAYTVQSAFPTMMREFTDLLNGLEIGDNPLPPVSEPSTSAAPQFETISLNDARVKVLYDSRKWRGPKRNKEDKITLSHVKGGGYAMIIPEKISVPFDSLPEIALSNARGADPDAKIVFREKRTIHGQVIWCLKISATVSKLPVMYYGYYYSGDAGTVQVLTYTTPTAFGEYEADFTELLNSLQFESARHAAAGSAQ